MKEIKRFVLSKGDISIVVKTEYLWSIIDGKASDIVKIVLENKER